MTTPSSRDLELLSAYLDGQLSPSSRTRLEIRIQSDPALAGALEELRQTRAFLRHTPHRRAPRNFTLTPRMAGIRPPVPRLVPVLSWASAAAMLLFIFSLGAGFIGQLSFGMAANSAALPKAAGGVPQAAATMAPVVAASAPMAPAATAPPATAAPATVSPALTVPLIRSTTPPAADQTVLPTPTEAISVMAVEQATSPAVGLAAQPPSALKALRSPVNLWLLIWAGLTVILAALAALILWLNKRAFQRKNPHD
jgi:anti-sigma factor RsiW